MIAGAAELRTYTQYRWNPTNIILRSIMFFVDYNTIMRTANLRKYFIDFWVGSELNHYEESGQSWELPEL